MEFKRPNHKQTGITTIEMSISGGIFVGIIVMSFQTMLAGAKLSSNTVASDNTKEQVEKSQKALVKDLENSNKLVASFTGSGYTHISGSNQISMVIPKFKVNKIDPAQYDVVTYHLIPETGKDGPNILMRTETKVKSSKSDAPTQRKIAKNVKALTTEFTTVLSLTPSAGKVSLPASISFGKPTGAQMQILSLASKNSGIQVGNPRVSINQNGISAVSLVALGLNTLSADLIPLVALPANSVFDIVSRVDPAFKPVATEPQNLANQVTFKITFVDPKSKGITKERILTHTVRLQNFQ